MSENGKKNIKDLEFLSYEDFKTGLTFEDVYEMLWEERRTSYGLTGQYKGRPSRRLVLGKWHQIKKESYGHYLDSFLEFKRQEEIDEDIPF